jgi:signal transduction histidine kinase
MRFHRSGSRPQSLRQAAATIFAISAILPLLLLLFYLWRFALIWQTEIQIGLFLALVVAVLGFLVFRRLVDRITGLAHALAAPDPATFIAAAPAAGDGKIAGLGQVSEIGEIAGAFGKLLDDLRTSTERLEDFVFKLGTLNEMVDLAARIPQIQDLLDLVLERSMKVVRATIGSIMLLDPERRTLRLVAARGLPDTARLGTEVNVDEGIAGRVIQIGEPILVDNIATDKRFAKLDDPRYGSGSFIGMPVRIGDRIIGVISLARKQGTTDALADQPAFSPRDLQFLSTLMGYAGYAVVNARLIEEMNQTAEQLKELVRQKSQYLAVMSHELRTPLNSIIGFSKVLLNRYDGDLTDRQENHVRLIYIGSMHLLQLINALLDMAAIEAGKQELDSEPFDLRGLVDECVESVAPLAADKGLTLEAAVAAELPRVTADRTKVKQILLNLLSNAIKFTGAGRIGLGVRLEPGAVHVSVTDTGPGIPEAELPKLFQPYQHHDRSPGKSAGGTGLGLAISKTFVEMHGGRIWAESEEKRGSTFHFTLPLAPGS